MLKLCDICKSYVTGDFRQDALRSVSLNFRESEFVAILGQSGSGKTTLLNIVGGLDRYDSGDLMINGISTTRYKDKDWDRYRNHSIGFVFQTYNLIPHQSVLANVELALTLSGVSKSERRARAIEVLKRVGLGDQIHKRPNQMSGGQMQRVAIARALINNPDILLADEPTGALDSETSVQIMDLLREIAGDRLIIMVTHNPELAEEYASRIIRLKDGAVVDDSDPYTDEQMQADLDAKEAKTETAEKPKKRKKQKTSMSFFTALSLSMNNLLTKKARTFLTSFAGSIGIIGIALILALSNGIQDYIDTVQEDTLSSYPLTIQKETMDMGSLLEKMQGVNSEELSHGKDAVYSQSVTYELINAMSSAETTTNNLKDFKTYLETDEEIQSYLTAVQYGYDLNLNIYTKDSDGNIVKSDAEDLMRSLVGASAEESDGETAAATGGNSFMTSWANMASSSGMFQGIDVWEELLPGEDGQTTSELLSQQYDLLSGNWPKEYNELVLIVDENNEISDVCLYALGLKTKEEMTKVAMAAMNKEEIEVTEQKWSYDEIRAMTFRAIPGCDFYQYDKATETYRDMSETETGMKVLYENGVELKVVGIVRPNEDATSSMMNGAIGYTSALTDYIIQRAQESDVVKAQQASPDVDVLTGFNFPSNEEIELTNAEKAAEIKEYYEGLNTTQKAEAYVQMQSTPSEDYVQAAVEQSTANMTRESVEAMMTDSYAAETGMDIDTMKKYVADMDDETLFEYVREMVAKQVQEQYAAQVQAQLGSLTTDQLAAALQQTIDAADEATMAGYYDLYMPENVSDSTYEDNLKKMGYVDETDPDSIYLYAGTFENKDAISDCITAYNEKVGEEDEITYTDYVALLMSSVTTIINAISYVLIAFVAISLVVSSIMIGIITYISVLERTKEIGVLRSIGASKRDVSRVFNAETLIVGLAAGLIGIGITILLCFPINAIVRALTGIQSLTAALPWQGGLILVLISMLLTIIAGLIPAKMAAKKDPVVALRSE